MPNSSIRFLSGGGRLPSDFGDKSHAIVKDNELYRILGKDSLRADKGIEAFVWLINTEQF